MSPNVPQARPWYRRTGLLVPIGTGLLGLVAGVAVGGGGSATAAEPTAVPTAAAAATIPVTATVTAPAAPQTSTVTRTAPGPAETIKVTVTRTSTPTATARDELGDAAVAASDDGLDPHFSSCEQAKADGFGPYVKGLDPEYDWYRDGDGNGVDCE